MVIPPSPGPGWVARNLRRVPARTGRIDTTVQPVPAAIVRYAILIFVFVAALSQIGVQTASLFAILGVAGLAIGLALQGTLTNIAAGIMLLGLRPFHLSEYFEVPANNISGTVREIGLFARLRETFEGIMIFAPNSAIWNGALRNHSRSRGRLVSLSVTLLGVLERFPKLRFALIESGIGWVPWALDAMDEAYKKHHLWAYPKLKQLPSEYFRQHGAISFQEDLAGLKLAEEFRLADNFLWANDYPHAEGSWPHSAEAIEREMQFLSDQNRAKILGLNIAKMFKFDEAIGASSAGLSSIH